MTTRTVKATGTYDGEPSVLAPAAVRGTNGAGAAVPVESAHTARLTLDVSAAGGGTPTMTVTVETSEDAASWRSVGAFPAVTAAGQQRRSFSGLDRFVRASWALGGTTPTFTFAVAGELV